MKLKIEKIKNISIILGILVFIGSILFTSNLDPVKVNKNKNYANIATEWTNDNFISNKNSYAKIASDWSGNSSIISSRSYAKTAAAWSGNDFKRSYSEITADWINKKSNINNKNYVDMVTNLE